MEINKYGAINLDKEIFSGKHFEDVLGNLQCVLVARRTIMNPDGVTWPQYDTLDILRQFQPMTPSAIGEKLGFARSKMSKILRTLKDAGFVEQMSGESDKREMLTRLAAKGVDFLNEAESTRHLMAEQVAACMSPGEIAIFTELCMRATNVLHENIKDSDDR
ncbi:MarR family transcriptional regulator [Serratia proteamaculans]|uniref:MarR family transcriptional regulator n=1 Tax=Serratia proteamaculans TaxID=28151 RepID=UPI002179B058|nr:MarR family transcriptional regulator [Serratia proteamaculans]CAI0978123.1 homoprotocatechuate degradation operon regulator, HpaR [Serratia proteamaculans]CAI1701207.1 homoprotocatechuate degradation operon regulator, HpaR [Serratia proteamaculans]